MIYSVVLLELVIYGAVRLFIVALEASIGRSRHHEVRKAMKEAKSYDEWYQLASELDKSQKRQKWQTNLNDFTAYHYSWTFIQELLSDMKLARENDDLSMAQFVLQQCIRKNVGGIMHEELYSYTNTGEPKLVVMEFVNEIEKTLQWATEKIVQRSKGEVPPGEPSLDAFVTFLDRARTAFGRTALCLSGGGMMGMYHLGTVRALFEEGILPNIISGASAGSMVAAIVCTRTDEELKRDLRPEVIQPRMICCAKSWPDRIRSLVKNGSMFDNAHWLELTSW